mmetsp:Transcript_2888/g.3972  ORF Transcript_2888/g.3972 Transcript_2888/m.3972 type:complete len:266 (-) Transcript_2888:144-941(-)
MVLVGGDFAVVDLGVELDDAAALDERAVAGRGAGLFDFGADSRDAVEAVGFDRRLVDRRLDDEAVGLDSLLADLAVAGVLVGREGVALVLVVADAFRIRSALILSRSSLLRPTATGRAAFLSLVVDMVLGLDRLREGAASCDVFSFVLDAAGDFGVGTGFCLEEAVGIRSLLVCSMVAFVLLLEEGAEQEPLGGVALGKEVVGVRLLALRDSFEDGGFKLLLLRGFVVLDSSVLANFPLPLSLAFSDCTCLSCGSLGTSAKLWIL